MHRRTRPRRVYARQFDPLLEGSLLTRVASRPASGSLAQVACLWVDVGQEAADLLGQLGSVGMPVSVAPDAEPVRRGV